ncbi:MAG: metallopeptidase TldD-related protein [Armatimonadota bacterium]
MLEQRVRELLCAARDAARREGIQAEFNFHRERSSLIRLGNSAVALSTSEELTRFGVRVQDGRRIGVYALTGDITSEEPLRRALHKAAEICAASPEKEYEPIFGEVEEAVDDSRGFDPALEAMPPEEKIELCAKVIGTISPRGAYEFSGSWTSGSTEYYYTTTANDREAYRRLTDGRLVLAIQEQRRKWEMYNEQSGKEAAAFSADTAIAEFDSLLPLYESQPGWAPPLGNMRVVFGPQAIGKLMTVIILGGFSGRMYEEQQAYTSGKSFSEQLFSPQVSITDEPDHPRVYGRPFDFNGRRRRHFALVDSGVFCGLMYDSQTAAKYGKAPTGHDNAADLVFATGDAPAGLAAAFALAGEGLYIPYLHYVHMPEPSKGMVTGSSRFNALRIDGGRPTSPLFSVRVTDSVVNMLSHVVAVASRPVSLDVSTSYERRNPEALSVPEYLICDNVRISDRTESF